MKSVYKISALLLVTLLLFSSCRDRNKVVNPAEVSEIVLTQNSIELKIGEEATLEYTILPKDAVDKELTWTSSDKSIATVSNGVVKAIAEGKATITATAKNGKVAKCTITVVKPEVGEVVFTQKTAELKVGEDLTIEYTVVPENAADQTLTWTSSNEAVATVSNGVVKAIALGDATITATTSNGKKAECAVTVVATEVTEVAFVKTTADLKVGEELTLQFSVLPEDATDKTLTWDSSNKDVATVSNGVVKAIALGSTTITATASNGKKAECAVTVVATEVTEVVFIKTKADLKVGEKLTLQYSVLPEDATDKTLTWDSSNKNVATVSNGIVTAIATGTATITATAKNGKQAKCVITVLATEVTEVVFVKTKADLNVGEKLTLQYNVLPEDATDKTLTWDSSNKDVATVSNGVVTAIASGTATITATAKNGKQAKCVITVRSNEADKSIPDVPGQNL